MLKKRRRESGTYVSLLKMKNLNQLQRASLIMLSLLRPFYSSAFLVDQNNLMSLLLQSKKKKRFSSLHDAVNNSNNNSNQEVRQAAQQVVKLGSKEYLEGFIRSPILPDSSSSTSRQHESSRASGMEQSLKLAGSVTVALVVLLLGFMVSNGLI
jgi:hypothetical protein